MTRPIIVPGEPVTAATLLDLLRQLTDAYIEHVPHARRTRLIKECLHASRQVSVYGIADHMPARVDGDLPGVAPTEAAVERLAQYIRNMPGPILPAVVTDTTGTSGHHVDYYCVDITYTAKGGPLYRAEAMDIIAALDMNFAEGEAFKAVWRCAAQRTLGKGKAGNDGVRDAQKVVFYGERMLEREKHRE